MKHTITVFLSSEAQRKALVAGQSAELRQTYEVPQELLARLLALPTAKVEPNGTVQYELNPHFHCPSVDARCDTRPENAAAAIDHAVAAWARHEAAKVRADREAEARREQQERDTREAVARWVALPLEWRASVDGVGYCKPLSAAAGYHGPLRTTGYRVFDLQDVERIAPEALAEAKAEVVRLREVARQVRDEAQARIQASIRAVLTDYAPALIERFDAGVLPQDELKDALQGGLLAPFAAFASYDPLTGADLSEDAYENDCCTFSAEDVEDGQYEATAEQWDAIKRFRRMAEAHKCTATVRLHTGTFDDITVYRLGVRICREYAPGKRVCRELSVD